MLGVLGDLLGLLVVWYSKGMGSGKYTAIERREPPQPVEALGRFKNLWQAERDTSNSVPTAGGQLCDTFTFENVRLVVQAIAAYLLSNSKSERGIVVGHDARFLGNALCRRSGEGINCQRD